MKSKVIGQLMIPAALALFTYAYLRVEGTESEFFKALAMGCLVVFMKLRQKLA